MSARHALDENDLPLHTSSRLTIGAGIDHNASMTMRNNEGSGNTSGDTSMLMRISSGFKHLTNAVAERAQAITFELYGTYSNEYSKMVQQTFMECYFLE